MNNISVHCCHYDWKLLSFLRGRTYLCRCWQQIEFVLGLGNIVVLFLSHFREDGFWVQTAITLSPVSSSGQKRWPSPPRSWHNRSSNMHDSWKWLCNPPPGNTLDHVQTHMPLIQYTSSQLKCSFPFVEGYVFIYCHSGSLSNIINQWTFILWCFFFFIYKKMGKLRVEQSISTF